MNEIILAISNLLFGVSIIIYFYLREIKHREDTEKQNQSIQNFYKEISISKDTLLKDISDKKDKLMNETFSAYLKHIQNLEKQITPRQDRFTQHILENQTPIETIPNEIEQTEEEEKEESFQEVFSKIPITPDTKVAFEGELKEEKLPEEIIT